MTPTAARLARLLPPPPDARPDGALLALPEKYRAPLVLCHLQGWSRRDAAERLG